MTRKEEISQAYTKYAQEGGILQSNPWFAFEAGARWADNNPKFIWYSPEEEPTENKVLVIDCDKGIKYYTLNYLFNTFGSTWEEAVNCIGIKYWCYVDNLLE